MSFVWCVTALTVVNVEGILFDTAKKRNKRRERTIHVFEAVSLIFHRLHLKTWTLLSGRQGVSGLAFYRHTGLAPFC